MTRPGKVGAIPSIVAAWGAPLLGWAAMPLLALTLAASAAEDRRILYDDTAMLLRFLPDYNIEIRFIDPPAILREIGVQPGQVLAQGRWTDAVLEGTAFLFAQGCKPIAYPVRGFIDARDALIILGPLPVLNGCEPTGQTEWRPASIMRFEPERSKAEEKDKRRKVVEPERPKPKPKPKPRPRPQQQPQQQQPSPYWYYPQQRW
jgi:hypothetical protein